MKTKLLALTLGLTFISNISTALEPISDRAQVKHITSTLLMPNGGEMVVDMSLDCGSSYENTGIIVTTEAGAKFLANAYSSLYGLEAGQKIKKAWQTKANEDDPRKPTMLLINSFGSLSWPGETQFKSTARNLSIETSTFVSEQTLGPDVLQLCGTRAHDPY